MTDRRRPPYTWPRGAHPERSEVQRHVRQIARAQVRIPFDRDDELHGNCIAVRVGVCCAIDSTESAYNHRKDDGPERVGIATKIITTPAMGQKMYVKNGRNVPPTCCPIATQPPTYLSPVSDARACTTRRVACNWSDRRYSSCDGGRGIQILCRPPFLFSRVIEPKLLRTPSLRCSRKHANLILEFTRHFPPENQNNTYLVDYHWK